MQLPCLRISKRCRLGLTRTIVATMLWDRMRRRFRHASADYTRLASSRTCAEHVAGDHLLLTTGRGDLVCFGRHRGSPAT